MPMKGKEKEYLNEVHLLMARVLRYNQQTGKEMSDAAATNLSKGNIYFMPSHKIFTNIMLIAQAVSVVLKYTIVLPEIKI